jgi:hypothetical protein
MSTTSGPIVPDLSGNSVFFAETTSVSWNFLLAMISRIPW